MRLYRKFILGFFDFLGIIDINVIEKCHENYIIIVTKQGEWLYGKWNICRNKEENRVG